jgi:glutamate 5-kinase
LDPYHLKDVKRFVVKVGTSSLTNEDSGLDVGKIANLVSDLMRQKRQGRQPILVSSGAIGAGMGKLKLTERPRGMPQLQAAAAIGQGILMQTYEYFFDSYDQPVAQILLTKDDFTDPIRNKNLRNTLKTILGWGVVPIINENDTVATEEIKVGDNDTLAALVSIEVDADLLVILTDVDGLYEGDPNSSNKGEFVRVVEEVTPEVEGWANKSGKGFGGMYTKLQAAKRLSEIGILTVISNAGGVDALGRVFDGGAGTVFLPRMS